MKIFNLFFSATFTFILMSSPLAAQQDYSNEIIVYFTKGVQRIDQTTQTNLDAAEIRAVLQKYNVRDHDVMAAFPDFVESDTVKITADGFKIGQPNFAKIFKIRTANASVRAALIEDLKKLPNVLFAEPNGIATPLVIPNDQYFNRQWGLNNTGQYGGTPNADIDAPEAWDIFTGSTQRKIGIIDWGVDAAHPDLSGKVTGDSYTIDHGTHVAGIAAAKANNSTGVAGVDWNARIISKNIDGLDDNGINSKIQAAVNEGADVLNNSWRLIDGYGNPRYSTTVRLAFAYAYKYNRVAAVAMGNDYGSVINYPAAFGQGIIAVGATTNSDTRAPYSTTGNHIDVSAPGGYWDQTERQIYSTVPGGGYTYKSGTSMATPIVTGIASLLKGYNPTLYNDDIENIIRLSADDKGPTGWDVEYGTGRVNARKALDHLRPPYTLTQLYSVGGTDLGASNTYQMTIYGAQALGLQDGTYSVKRHEIQKAVSYAPTSSPSVWGRGAATNGWANEGTVNFTYGWCEPVAGTITSSSATLRTFIYEVFNSQMQFLGWYPNPASNVRFEYTVHGTWLPPSNLTATTVSGTQINLNWIDNSSNEDGFKLERKLNSSGSWVEFATVGPNVTSYSSVGLTPGETYYYRVRAYNGSTYSSYSNEANAATPFTYATIIGPDYLMKGQTGYWTANPSEGSYHWWYRLPPDGSFMDTGVLTRDFSLTMQLADLELKVSVTKFGITKDAFRYVYYGLPKQNTEFNLPKEFVLDQNHPNPFNPTTIISFALPTSAFVNLEIYNTLGQKVRTLLNNSFPAGYHDAIWDAKNGNGVLVPSGIYFYRVRINSEGEIAYQEIKKMFLLK